MSIHKLPQRLFLCIISLLMINTTYGQTDSDANNPLVVDGANISIREISGYITSSKTPLVNVNIRIKNTSKGTKTNIKGFYTIKAKEGEVLIFSHIGMHSLEIIIEDVTKILNIKMRVKENTLDEVTVRANRKQKDGFTEMDKPKTITTARGNIDTRKAGYSISYVDGEDLSLSAITLGQALVGRVAGLKITPDAFGNEFATLRGPAPKIVDPKSTRTLLLSGFAIWDIDGMIFKFPPHIDLNNIKDVSVIRSLAGTNAYGQEGAHGVIVVRTKTATFDKIDPTSKSNPYINKKYYQEDAIGYKELKSSKPEYLLELDTISNAQQAYKMYQKMILSYSDLPAFYLDVSKYFKNVHQNNLWSFEVLSEMETAFANNPEALKALAYTYQEQGLYKKVVTIYKNIMRLRPNYAQSFRDLANAYVDIKEYKRAWKIYMNYLYRGNKLDDNGGIGKIIYHEMEALYIHKKDIANIRESFELNGEPDELSNDVRIVFEWNTSEAEFELEFVNPQKQSYTIEHSFFADKDLITDEKSKGYSSREFMIEDLNTGDWLINLKYFGNKTHTPTYLKMTIYFNWEKSNQMQEIKLFKLTENSLKLQLLKLNKKLLPNNYK